MLATRNQHQHKKRTEKGKNSKAMIKKKEKKKKRGLQWFVRSGMQVVRQPWEGFGSIEGEKMMKIDAS
ncbi:hypothetical protein SLEP1_g44523 [Rubroshorea leprosula]|uniref:Uncharacterized protein n=1 Tax=Rubroshorea leprosula TaxID=152421 RepID=A0AAV5LGF6_9ROSI|nr:hypothetical protein SLEP1_g44523 [Rubroshorea leprosula]